MTAKATGRMTRREHPSIAAAMREAFAHGYGLIHRSDGLYMLARGRADERLAIAREDRPRSSVWHLVPEAELVAHLANVEHATGPAPGQAIAEVAQENVAAHTAGAMTTGEG